jgi:hypothetical protein
LDCSLVLFFLHEDHRYLTLFKGRAFLRFNLLYQNSRRLLMLFLFMKIIIKSFLWTKNYDFWRKIVLNIGQLFLQNTVYILKINYMKELCHLCLFLGLLAWSWTLSQILERLWLLFTRSSLSAGHHENHLIWVDWSLMTPFELA